MKIMRFPKNSINAKNAAILLVFFFMCMHYDNNNPYDASYPSSKYKCKVDWSTLPETCLINTPYPIACSTSLERDTFDHFYGHVIPLDPSFKAKITKIKFDSFTVSFNKELTGKLIIAGIRPNSLALSDTGPDFIVINQFKPRLDSLMDTFSVIRGTKNILVNVRDSLDSVFTVFWRIKDSSRIDSAAYTHSRLNSVCSLRVHSTAEKNAMDVWIRNSKYVSDIFTLTVFIQPFVPTVKIAKWPDRINYHDSLRFSIEAEALTLNFRASVKSKDGRYADTSADYANKKNAEIAMKSFIDDTGLVQLSVRVMDIDRASESEEIACSLYIDPQLPLLLDSQWVQIPLGFPQKIEAVSRLNPAVQYHWALGDKGSDPYYFETLTDSSFITRIFNAELRDTLHVFGINQYKFAGPAVGIYLSVVRSAYLLSAMDAQFPSHVAARDSVRFEVTIDKPAQLADNKGIYTWTIDSGSVTIFNKTGPQLTSIDYFFPDSGRYGINVIARDTTGDASNLFGKLVTVHRYAPRCWFDKREKTLFLSQKDTVRLNYSDALNPDGSGEVVGVYWDLNGDNLFEIVHDKNPLMILPQEITTTVGAYVIRAYVKDNDGFSSAVDSLTINVISSAPYKSGSLSDTAILVGSQLTVKSLFKVSEGQPAIQRHFWILNSAIMMPETTDILTRTFNSVGIDTVIVSCINKSGVYSPSDTFCVFIVSEKKPVVYSMKPDTVWIKDDTTYTINGTSLKNGVPIVAYNIAWNLGDTFMHFTSSTVKRQYTYAGIHVAKIYIVDRDAQASDTVYDTVLVRKGAPQCDSIVPDVSPTDIFVKKPQTYAIWSHDTNGTVEYAKILWKNGDTSAAKGPQTAQGKTSFSYTFPISDAGACSLKAVTQDEDGFWSDTCRLSFQVRLGKPVVRSVRKDSVITIESKKRYTVNAKDSAGGIDSFFISFNNGAVYRAMKDSMIDTQFTSVGKRYIKAYVKNDRGIPSDTLKDSVNVESYQSSIKNVRILVDAAKDNIYVSDSRIFTVNGIDSLGKVAMVLFAWKENIPFYDTAKAANDTTFTIDKSFNIADTAIKNIRVRLINDRAQIRDSLYAISIRLCKPVVDSISPRTVIVNDDTTFVIAARDTNGTVDTVIVDWDDQTPVERKARGEAIKHKFAITQSGTRRIKMVARDDDRIFSDTCVFPITVRLCKPVVDSLSPRTVWVGDDTTFAVFGRDTNGTIDSFLINWGDLTPPSRHARTDPVKHKFPITQSGVRTARVFAKDNDGIWGDSSISSISVRLGKPWVKKVPNNDTMHWSDTLPGDNDTMVCPFRSGLTTIAVGVGDSNGTVKKVFWDVNNGMATNSAATTIWATNSLAKDTVYRIKVWCMDEDSVISDTMRFFVLPHIPPPQITSLNYDGGYGRIFWDGKDASDGDATLYRVIMKKSGTDSILVSDEINGCAQCYSVGFKTGFDSGHQGSLNFDWSQVVSQMAPSGNYWYKIYMRNSKGQTTRMKGVPMLSF